jgi:hypothetical protein
LTKKVLDTFQQTMILQVFVKHAASFYLLLIKCPATDSAPMGTQLLNIEGDNNAGKKMLHHCLCKTLWN